jgi:hypothetical protein
MEDTQVLLLDGSKVAPKIPKGIKFIDRTSSYNPPNTCGFFNIHPFLEVQVATPIVVGLSVYPKPEGKLIFQNAEVEACESMSET